MVFPFHTVCGVLKARILKWFAIPFSSGPRFFMASRRGNGGNSGWLYFRGLQNQCRWWLQPWNLKTFNPWKESYDQPGHHIKKERHYLTNKVHLFKAMVFPVVMYGCESWTVKKAERRKIDAFELRCWIRLMRVPYGLKGWDRKSVV